MADEADITRGGLKPHLPLPAQSYLRSRLDYQPSTGELLWRPRRPSSIQSRNPRQQAAVAARWNRNFAGKPALAVPDGYGYLCGSVDDVKYQAHRIIWKLVYGDQPELIDHINGKRADNRLINLRSVSHAENQRNQKRFSTNTSGETGVYFAKGKWRARLRVNGKTRQLGGFETFLEAVACRERAKMEFGFHPNHGRAP